MTCCLHGDSCQTGSPIIDTAGAANPRPTGLLFIPRRRLFDPPSAAVPIYIPMHNLSAAEPRRET